MLVRRVVEPPGYDAALAGTDHPCAAAAGPADLQPGDGGGFVGCQERPLEDPLSGAGGSSAAGRDECVADGGATAAGLALGVGAEGQGCRTWGGTPAGRADCHAWTGREKLWPGLGLRHGAHRSGPAAASAHRLRSLPRLQPHECGRGRGPTGGASAAAANRRSDLKGSRQLWLYEWEGLDLTRRRELRTLLLAPELKTGLAWDSKEQPRTPWQYQPPSAARALLDGWHGRFQAIGLPPLTRVANIIFTYLEGILDWMPASVPQGPVEIFNSATQTLKINARRYSNLANFRIATIIHRGNVIPSHTNLQTITTLEHPFPAESVSTVA